MANNGRGRAFPDKLGSGMTRRQWLVGEQTAAWIIALSARHNEAGYSDITMLEEATRLGNLTAVAILDYEEKEKEVANGH